MIGRNEPGTRIALLLVIAFLLPSCAYFNTYYNTRKYFDEALKERQKRTGEKPSPQERQKFDKTINQASKVLQLYPESKYIDDALMVIGQSFYYIEEYRKAERKFREIVELFPDGSLYEPARLWLARTQLQLDNYEDALRALKALNQTAKNKSVRNEAEYWIAECYWLQKNYTDAVRAFHQALDKVGSDELRFQTCLRLGDCYEQLGSFHQAAANYEQAAKKAKNLDGRFDATIRYAKALTAAGEPQRAVEILSSLIERDDQHRLYPIARLELANAYLALGGDDKAIELYNAIIEDHPRTTAAAGAFLALAQYDEKVLHNFEAAEKSYSQVKMHDPKSEYVAVANRQAKNISHLLRLRKEIAQLQSMMPGADQPNSAGGAMQDIRIDDSIDAARQRRQNNAWRRQEITTQAEIAVNRTGRPDRRRFVAEAEELASSKEEKRPNTKSGGQTPSPTARQAAPAPSRSWSATQIDSIQTLITEKKLEMAELFLFSFELADSALYYYLDAISGSKSIPHRALAFYSIAHIYDAIKPHHAIRDSVLKILAKNYSQTPQGRLAARRLGMPVQVQQENPQSREFEIAQGLLFNEKRPRAAVPHLQKILSAATDGDLRLRTLYTLGWTYENMLHDNTEAIRYYRQLLKEAPASEYARRVRKKIDAIERAEQAENEKEATTATSKKAQSAGEVKTNR